MLNKDADVQPLNSELIHPSIQLS